MTPQIPSTCDSLMAGRFSLGFGAGGRLPIWHGVGGFMFNSSSSPLLPQQHHRRVARLGLAMDNLESDWDFAPSSLALATTSGHFALRICAVDLKNAPMTAAAVDKIKQCLAASQISVEVADIKRSSRCARGRNQRFKTYLSSRHFFRRRPKCSDWCATAHPEPIDTFLTLRKSEESRRRVHTRRAPRWRSCLSMERSLFRWPWSALRCVSLRRMVLRGPPTCRTRCWFRLWWRALTLKLRTSRERSLYMKRRRRTQRRTR